MISNFTSTYGILQSLANQGQIGQMMGCKRIDGELQEAIDSQ
jgi:hypothetical protein